jgi:phosphonate degradation associated HDIG domain protein
MNLSLSEILQVYHQKGRQLYGGEAVSQLEHALQCATLAEAANQPPAMIVACLLHDIGHLLPALATHRTSGDSPSGDAHAACASAALRQLFSPAITEPIRLHVEAKRYLCATEPDYWQNLSIASQQSLERQGGIFCPEAAQTFIAQPYAAEAVQLRRWDDAAKVVGLSTADLSDFALMLTACASKDVC